jgi:hypothetical protein
MEPADLGYPLAQFNVKKADQEGVSSLIQALYESIEETKPKLEDVIANFNPGFPRWPGFRLTSCPAFGRKARSLRGEK